MIKLGDSRLSKVGKNEWEASPSFSSQPESSYAGTLPAGLGDFSLRSENK